MLNNPAILALMLSTLTAVNFTFVARVPVENFFSGIIIRGARGIRPGRRIKLLVSPQIIKGEVISIGPFRTSLMEIGDGEHLPSIRTGRVIKVPNSMLVNTAIVVYGDTIVDEVVAQVKWPGPDLDEVLARMYEAIREADHTPVEVGLFQRDGHLVIHGVFEVGTPLIADERTKVLKNFLQKMESDSRRLTEAIAS